MLGVIKSLMTIFTTREDLGIFQGISQQVNLCLNNASAIFIHQSGYRAISSPSFAEFLPAAGVKHLVEWFYTQ